MHLSATACPLCRTGISSCARRRNSGRPQGMHRPASCTALNTKLEQWRHPCGDVEEGHLAPPEAGQPCTRRIVPEDYPHQQPAGDASQTATSSRAAGSGRAGHAPGSAGREAGWRRGCCLRRIPSTGRDRLLCHLPGMWQGGLEPPQCPPSPSGRIRSSHDLSNHQICLSHLVMMLKAASAGCAAPARAPRVGLQQLWRACRHVAESVQGFAEFASRLH